MAEYTGDTLTVEDWEKQQGKKVARDTVVPLPTNQGIVEGIAQAAMQPTSLLGLSPVEIAGGGAALTALVYAAKKTGAGLKARSILKSPETVVQEAGGPSPIIDVEAKEVPLPKSEVPEYNKPAYQRAGAASPFDIKQPTTNDMSAVQQLRQKSDQIRAATQTAPAATQTVEAPTTVTEAVATGQSPTKTIQADLAQKIDAPPEVTTTGKTIGRPPGAKNLTAAQREMVKAGEAVAGGRNWLLNQFGGDAVAYEQFIKQFNQGADFPNYKAAVASIPENLGGPFKSDYLAASKGKPAGTMKAVAPPETSQSQKGSISPSAALNIAGNALGAYGLMQAYKEGKQTGDWSNLGLGTIGQILSNVAPRAGLAFSLMAPSSTNEGEQEALRQIQYEQKVGAGRGIAPPSAYAR